jgi:hypothetical protein
MEAEIWKTALCMCERLQEAFQQQSVIESRLLFLAWTTDTLTNSSFSEDWGLLNDVKLTQAHQSSFEALAVLYPLLKQCSWIIPLALRMPMSVFKVIFPPLATILEVHRDVRALSERACQQEGTGKAQDERPNLLRCILESDLPPEEKTAGRMSHEGFETLLAGTGTTARTLQLAVYYILSRPDVEQSLKQELKSVMPEPDTVIDLQALQDLPWLVG